MEFLVVIAVLLGGGNVNESDCELLRVNGSQTYIHTHTRAHTVPVCVWSIKFDCD